MGYVPYVTARNRKTSALHRYPPTPRFGARESSGIGSKAGGTSEPSEWMPRGFPSALAAADRLQSRAICKSLSREAPTGKLIR
jgi:hypothetical protein